MEIKKINENRRQFIPLLLIGDEDEKHIEKYIESGEMFALYDGDECKTICILLYKGNGVFEIKNIATAKEERRKGYAGRMVDYICEHCRKNHGDALFVGTGESPLTLPFYEKMGFEYSHRVNNFYTENFDHEIIEAGVKLRDMIFLKKELR